MKTVFTNAMCAHVWAQQNQLEGHANSVHFSGPVMFYYVTPVAMFHETKEGRVCLVTSQTYSVSTSSKCMPAVRRAIHGMTTFSVPWVGYGGARGRDHSEPSHAANLKHLVARCEEFANRVAKSRNPDLASLLPGLEERADTALRYARAFGLRVPAIDPGKMNNDVVAKRAAFDTPEAKAKRAKAAARAKLRAAAAEQVALVGRRQRQYDWRHNVAVHMGPEDRYDETRGALLRIVRGTHGKDDVVQTSLGAVVPLNDARRVLKFIKAVHDPQRNVGHFLVQDASVGSFRVDFVHSDGSITAGCHKISAAEIQWFTDALTLHDAQAAK